MKSFARTHVWWPGIDRDIENTCAECVVCAKHAKDPPKSPLSVWDYPISPWQRLPVDYAGPFLNCMWLIWIDAHSKYGGVERVENATGDNTVKKLSSLFSFFGNREQIVSDNGTPFTSREFGEFCSANGIRHIRSAPYHPSINGEAERFVQVIKRLCDPISDTRLKHSRKLIAFFNATVQFLTRRPVEPLPSYSFVGRFELLLI